MTDRTPYAIPKEPGRWRAIVLAAAVHAALVAFLWIGVHWQSQVPVAVEAEIWNSNMREAAPRPPAPEPTPEPVAKPVQQPEPKPVVQEAPPPPKVVKPTLPDPEIALEKERKRKVLEQKDHDRAEQARKDKERQRKADEQAHKDQQKKDAEKQKAIADAKKKADAEDKKTAEAADKQKAKQDAAKKEKEKEKAAADKARQADADATNKRHNDDMKRLQGQASGNGGANSTGTAAQSQGPRGGDPGYAQKVGAKIKGNINFNVPDGMPGNPAVEFEVQLLPDGSVAGIQLRKSSGVSGFDEAVKRAIERSAPYPKDKSGSVPSSFIGIHKPKDQ